MPGRAGVAAKPPEGEALSGSGQEGGKQLQGRQPALSAVTPQPGTAPSPQEVLDKRFLEQVRVCTPASTSPPPPVKGCLFLSPFQSRDSFYLIKKAASQDPAASTSWRINRPEHSVVPQTIVWS